MSDNYDEFENATEEEREEALKALGLGIEFEHILERSDNPDWKGTHFKVKLFKKDRLILETQYSKGIGQFQRDLRENKWCWLPSFITLPGYTRDETRRFAIKDSKLAERYLNLLTIPEREKISKKYPSMRVSLVEFMYSITIDATIETFEDWCSNFGFDTDSRKAYKTYEACRDTFSKLYSGGVDIEEVRRICHGY